MVTQTFQRKNLYKDLDISFEVNPLTGDLGTKSDAAAINQSIKNLLFTNYYERPFNPTIGSNIRQLLFELADPITINELRHSIRQTIVNHEPRVTIQDILLEDLSDRNAYAATIIYRINRFKEPFTLTFTLKRLR
jgi:phage baseplate assembly protein W